MAATDEKLSVPPYVAYKTLKNFLEKFKQGLPGRIDRGLMGSMSGAAQSQVTTALRYLGMISENSIPTDVMKRYVTGDEPTRKLTLREVLGKSYPFIFGAGAGRFDLSAATASQLREEFEENTKATGETVGRCIAFLKDACVDADVLVSPYIMQKKSRIGGKRKPASPRREESKSSDKTKGKKEEHVFVPATPQHGTAAAQESMLLWGLFQKLPKPRTVWLRADREQWVQTLQNVLLLEYPETDV
jgi:hypothetical protein